MGARSVSPANSIKKLAGSGKAKIPEGPHATPNSAVVLPMLREKHWWNCAGDACIEAIGTKNQEGALMALSYMHDSKIVEQLVNRFSKMSDSIVKQRVAKTLIRLVNKEKCTMEKPGGAHDTRNTITRLWEKTEMLSKPWLKQRRPDRMK